MKKLMKFIIYIFLISILTILLSLLMIKNTRAAADMSPRGKPLVISWSPGSGWPGPEIWLQQIMMDEILCSKQGGSQTFGRGPKIPEVEITLKTTGSPESGTTVISSKKYTSWEDTKWEEVYWKYGGDDVKTLKIDELKAHRTNQPSGKSGNPIPGKGDDSSSGASAHVTVYTNGKTEYKPGGGGGSYKNNALAYVLAEEADDDGKMPAASIINVCFWMLQHNPDAADGSISTAYFTGTGGAGNLSSVQNIIANLRELLNDSSLSAAEKQSIRSQIAQMEDILEASSVKDEMNDVSAETASASSSLYREALIFGKMWKDINSYGSYINSVSDKTDLDNVHVQFNSIGEDGKTFYIVGPFSIKYLEYYTVGGSNGGQFCGMAKDPILEVEKWGNPATLKLGDEYEFVYGKFLDDQTFAEGRASFPNIPDGYDAYPHSEEEFYLKIKYQEGLNAISRMQFFFRYLSAEASTVGYTGTILTQQWDGTVEIETCTDGSPCDHDTEHESPQSHGTGTYPADNPDTEEDESQNEIMESCSGGKKCKHGFYHKHVVKATLVLEVKYNGKYEEFQDNVYVTGSKRLYLGAEGGYGGFYGDAITSDSDESKIFKWKIDLTTTLNGWVWKDLTPDEKKGSTNLIGQWEGKSSGNTDARAGDVGIQNVEVDVYLCDESGAKHGKALIHNRDGGKEELTFKTDGSGKWNHEDFTFEAPGKEPGLFYLIEFQYDGQFFKDVPFLGNGVGADNYMNEQDASHAYDPDMNSEEAERSKAVTEVAERKKFDQSFGEITGESPMNGDRTEGITYETSSYGDRSGGSDTISYNKKPATDINSKEYFGDGGGTPGGYIPVVSRLDEPYDEDSNSPAEHQKEFGSNYDRYRLKATTWYGNTSTDGCAMNPESYRTRYPKKKIYFMDTLKFGKTHLIDEYMRHLNLGLTKRKETDLSIIKDLYKLTVVVNEQKQVYKFNPYGLTQSKFVELEQCLESVRGSDGSTGYSLGLYSNDVAYSSMKRYEKAIQEVRDRKEDTELRVFASYVIRLYNNSDTEDAEFKEVRDYYDNDFTLVQRDYMAADGAIPYESVSTDYANTKERESMGKITTDGFLVTSIVNDEMKRETTRMAETPYYRICSQNSLNVWGATKEENISGFENGTIEWQNDAERGGSKSLYTDSLKGIKIDKEQYIEIFTTFEVDKNGYESVRGQNLDPDEALDKRLNLVSEAGEDQRNTAEIKSYSTYYGPENQYRNHQVGWVAGRVDKDSAPNNVVMEGDGKPSYGTVEDDTFEALLLKLKFKAIKRHLEGTVFEDKKNTEIKMEDGSDPHPVDQDGNVDASEKLIIKGGDGILNGSDVGVDGVEVSLYEVINLGELDINESGTYAGLEYYYKVPETLYGGIQTTSGGGHYDIDDFLAGDYVVRFDYGKNKDSTYKVYSAKDPEGVEKDIIKYNGQDYENTKFLGDALGTGNDSKLNMKFLPIDGKDPEVLKEKDVSKARDNESRRLEVDGYSRTIENERAEILRDRLADGSDESKEFIKNTKMFAETPIIKVEVEDPALLNKDAENVGDEGKGKLEPGKDDTTIKVYEEGGKTSEFGARNLEKINVDIKKIDFGMEERARTDIELKTFINKMQIFKADELVFTVDVNDDGTINYETETSRSRKLTSLPTDYGTGKNQQGFYAIEIENDYLNGLNLIIQYKLQVINNSEIDFTSRLGGLYRQDVINAYAGNTPTTTFYEDIIDDTAAMLANSKQGIYSDFTDVDNERTLTISDIGPDNVFRLNSNAIKEIFKNGHNIKTDPIAINAGNGINDAQETDTIKPEVIIYGLLTGRYYYENKILNTENNKETYTIKDYLRKKGDSTPIEVKYDRDKVVKTSVNKLVEYVDVDASLDLPPQGYVINYAWDRQGEGDKQGAPDQVSRDADSKVVYDKDNSYYVFSSLISDASYRTENGDTGSDLDFYDLKNRKYINIGQSNIGFSENDCLTNMKDASGNDTNRQQYSEHDIINNRNLGLSRQLEPAYYVIPRYMDEKYGGAGQDKEVYFKELEENPDGTINEEGKKKKERVVGEMYVRVTKITSSAQDADEINIDNIAEILVYSNSTGRRDTYSVPGNALAIGAYAAKSDSEKNVWHSGYNSIRMGAAAYGRQAFAARNLLVNSAHANSGITPQSARSTPDGEWPNGKINGVAQQWTVYPEDDQWATEYVSVIPPTGIALRNFVKSNLPQVVVGTIAIIGLAVLFINKQIKIRRNKDKF